MKIKSNQSNLAYPKVANFDDQIVEIEAQELNVRTLALPKENFTISNLEGSAIVVDSADSAVFTVKLDAKGEVETYFVQAVGNNNALYFNDSSILNLSTEFKIGDTLSIGGIVIERRKKQLKVTEVSGTATINNWILSIETYNPEYPLDFPEYRRSPRIHLLEPKDKITVSDPESADNEQKNELVKTILPSLGMVAVSVLSSVLSGGNPMMMIGMGAASVMIVAMSISSFFTNKKENKEKALERIKNYEAYLIDKASEVNTLAKEQRKALDFHFPDMEELADLVCTYNPRIYEKTPVNADFLEVSLGIGTLSSSYGLEYTLDEQKKDELVTAARETIVDKYSFLKEAPITTSLLNQTVGLAGIYPVLKTAVSTMLLQIATFHSYRDVQFLALAPESDYDETWKKWRWLPHFQLEGMNLRGIIHNMKSRDMVLNSFYQLLNKRKQSVREASKGSDKIKFSPHYILTILDDSYLSGHGLNEFLAEDMSEYGVTVIWGKEAPSMLPETVTTMIHYVSVKAAQMLNENKIYVATDFKPYQLPTNIKIEVVLSHLANLHHVEVEKNAIPEAVSFLEMYHVKTIEELSIENRWQVANTAKSLAVPLGLRGKDDLVNLNLHERADGPHGLVAGTTGSGKSEIVQSYILSLAVNFAPEDVGFLPIDFKGGGMANLFANMPHLLGSITNLDGASSARALASIRAELKKRQRYFGQYGVNHINGYTKLYKQGKSVTDPVEKKNFPSEPMPHLFLISDEFAELKANEPEFMAELVSAARIGRSLGVHLILATQKPSGVVDDQIWSNSRFKLALKVQDASDSNEIIKTPDAASITLPGRAYLQVGNNEIYELFQSAWSGATYNPDLKVEEKADERIWLINDFGQYELLTTDLSEHDEVHVVDKEEKVTELEAIVDYIAEMFQRTEGVLPEKPWLPPLEDKIVTPKVDREKAWREERNLAVSFGRMDIPEKQSQETFMFDFSKLSHTAIYASTGFGKSTALQTLVMNLARQNTPAQVQFNLFDFGTNGLLPLKDLPHVADIVKLEEEEKLVKFVLKIRSEINERKELFTEYGVASLAQYESKSGKKLPVQITVVDGYDPLRESELEDGVESVLNQILRDGASIGMYLVMTGIRVDTFKMSMTSNIPTRIGLFLVEEGAIKDVVGREALIAQEIIGRGQIKLEMPVSLQVYLSNEGETDIERLSQMEAEIKEMRENYKGEKPKPIPMVPKVLKGQDFYSNEEVTAFLEVGNIPLGINMNTTEVVGFRPKEDGYFIIADDQPTQTEFIEKTIISSLKQLDGRYNRTVLDVDSRFANLIDSDSTFDTIVQVENYLEYITGLISEIEDRLENLDEERRTQVVYVPETLAFAETTFFAEDQIKRLVKNGPSVGVYFIFQADKSKLDSAYDEVSKYLCNNPPAGFVGSRLTDQEYIKVKADYGEAQVGFDQTHYFANRQAVKVKLVSEWV
jgi:S-DNA-T family DNA segregation ATPase FtsK/SpoIIIE